MKKLLAVLSALSIMLSLCACSADSVEDNDKKQSSSLAQNSEEDVSASEHDSDQENLSESSAQTVESENSKDTTLKASKESSSKADNKNANGAAVTTVSANNKQGDAYSYYVTEYETVYVKKTVKGTRDSSTRKGSTASKEAGKPSVVTSIKSSSRVNAGTSKSASKARITVSQNKIDISSVLSNPNLSQSVKKNLEKTNPYVSDYGMLVPSYSSVTVTEGSTVLDVLELVLSSERKGSNDFAANPGAVVIVKNSGFGRYVSSICGLAEMDCGSMSGWMYKVNGKISSVSADKYVLKSGDKIEWVYAT